MNGEGDILRYYARSIIQERTHVEGFVNVREHGLGQFHPGQYTVGLHQQVGGSHSLRWDGAQGSMVSVAEIFLQCTIYQFRCSGGQHQIHGFAFSMRNCFTKNASPLRFRKNVTRKSPVAVARLPM